MIEPKKRPARKRAPPKVSESRPAPAVGAPVKRRRFRVDPEWRKVLRRAWSVRLIAAAVLVQGAGMVLPAFEARIPPLPFSLLGAGLSVAGIWAMVILQKAFDGE